MMFAKITRVALLTGTALSIPILTARGHDPAGTPHGIAVPHHPELPEQIPQVPPTMDTMSAASSGGFAPALPIGMAQWVRTLGL